MKNLFAFGFLALALTVASCGGTTKTEETADSLTNVVDSTAAALTDSLNATADSAKAVIDSTVTAVDSTVNAQ